MATTLIGGYWLVIRARPDDWLQLRPWFDVGLLTYTLWLILREPEQLFGFIFPRSSNFATFALAALGIGSLCVVLFLDHIGAHAGPDQQFSFLDVLPPPIAILEYVLLPAFVEEVLFRGYMLRRFLMVTGRWVAAALQAGLFAAYHMDGQMFVSHLCFGFGIALLAMAARTIWLSIAVHVVWNLLFL